MKTLNGIYRFKESVSLNGSVLEADVAFTSNGTTYSKMLFNSGMLELIYDDTQVYVGFGSGWIDEAYKEVSFRNQTVNDDFYSWFMENAEFVKENEPLTLNGTYVFNETVNYPYDYPSFFGFEYYVPFYCNGILCSGMNFGSTGMEEIDFIGLGFAYQGIGMGWQNEAYKKVTFDNQAVSDDFYDWLTKNSSPAKTLDGAYKFNESVNVNDFVEYVTFISKGGTYSKMSFEGGLIELYYNGVRAFGAIEIGGWADEAYRTVIFDNQGVSETFYNFITSNATPTEAPLLNGIYTFNEVVWVGEVIEEVVTFASNGRMFSKMRAYGFPEILYDETFVYQGLGMGDWTINNEAFRTVTFDNQLVSEAFHNFVTSNATLDKTVYTIEKFTLKKIADAIREKKGTTADIPVSRLGNEVGSIETGGGDEFPADKYFEGGYAEVVLPNATKIKRYSFYQDTTLQKIEMPNVTSIEGDAFNSCSNLALTELPSGLTSIGVYAFYNCYGLRSLTFRGTPNSISGSAFYGCGNIHTINVPWAEGAVANAPWGAKNATINYNYTGE